MSAYQILTSVISVIAVFISALAYRNAVKARRIAAESTEISRKSLAITERQNTPRLLFRCTTAEASTWFVITVSVINVGREPTIIFSGQITLHSYEYPNADKSEPLNGIQIPGGSEHTVKINEKRLAIHSGRPGPELADIYCDAVYRTGDNASAHETTEYTYNKETRRFIPKQN